MRHFRPMQSDGIQQPPRRTHSRLATAVVAFCFSLSAWGFQIQPKRVTPGPRKTAPKPHASQPGTPQKPQAPDVAWLEDALRNPELMTEVGHLAERLQKEVHLPASRSESPILSRLPEQTILYAALPNYGEPARQAVQIFQEELKESAALREFLQKNKVDTAEPLLEKGIERFYEFSQFLGDELVIDANLKGEKPGGVLLAEIKKPGLQDYLAKLNAEVFPNRSDRLRIFDEQQLATVVDQDEGAAQGPAVLIRKDLVIAGLSVAALREINSQIDRDPRLASSALGQKLAQTYRGGIIAVGGLDLQRLIALTNKPQDKTMLEKTGFADVSYLVTSYTPDGSQFEVAFNGPRRGVASWIAAPRPMGALDFISPHAAIGVDVILKSPALIFDELREIPGDGLLDPLAKMEDQLKINLKSDLLSNLTGEIAIETQPLPIVPQVTSFNQDLASPNRGPFKVILGVSDPAVLQQTLVKLLAALPAQTGQREEDGIIFNTVTLPTSPSAAPVEINYFFLDGYLVVASDRASAREAARQHQSGETLRHSSPFHDALAGHSADASIMFYQDVGRMLAPMLAQLPPELNKLMSVSGTIKVPPTVFTLYADPTTLHGFSETNMQVGMAVPMIVAAVSASSLTRARAAANESAATTSLRTVNTAQMTYAGTYPNQGYAPNLATLGKGARGVCSADNGTATQACLVDNSLAGTACTTGKWCVNNGYKFMIRAVCMQGHCLNYAVTATPVGAVGRSFCSTSDAVIRSHQGAPVAAALTATECKAWPPLR